MKRLASIVMLMGLVALVVTGCGSSGKYANDPVPPEALIINAEVTPGGITMSPATFGAGLVRMVISNQTESSQQVTVQGIGDVSAAGETAPINPGEIADLQTNLPAGTYSVSTGDASVPANSLVVTTAARPNTDRLLEP